MIMSHFTMLVGCSRGSGRDREGLL